jgi:hypothetical protein
MKTAKTAIDIAVYWFTTRTSSVIFIYYLLFGKEFVNYKATLVLFLGW